MHLILMKQLNDRINPDAAAMIARFSASDGCGLPMRYAIIENYSYHDGESNSGAWAGIAKDFYPHLETGEFIGVVPSGDETVVKLYRRMRRSVRANAKWWPDVETKTGVRLRFQDGMVGKLGGQLPMLMICKGSQQA